jgi:integrase
MGWTDTAVVFTSTTGTPLVPDNLRRSWYPLRKKIGADGTRFHDLRHSCVTMLLALGGCRRTSSRRSSGMPT